jgi:iron complex transport system substrate-binding protein
MRHLFLGLALLAASPACAETFIDSAGRRVELPAQVVKVLAAGPPASVIVYTLAPEKFLGWTRAPDGEALSYLPLRFRVFPVQGRITGGNPADPASIKALGANVIVDFGTVNAS